jgi:hypothetical protein
VLNQIVGGWQIGGITSVSSGNWFTILDTNAVSNSDGQQRPDLIGNPHAKPCVSIHARSRIHHQVPLVTSAATAFRDRVTRFGTSRCSRTSPLPRSKLEFRAEFFNVFNHPNLQFAKSGPQNSINTTTFGTPAFGFLTAARDPRQIQFAVKFSF